MANNEFVNPYNFIPLAEEAPERGPVRKGNLSGVIKYTLMTRTPLIIPNTSNDHVFDVRTKNENKADAEHKSYDFFSYDDLSKDTAIDRGLLNGEGFREGLYSEPVIPGSEVRGMFRSYYEILTNSCMSFVDDDEILSKRTGEVYKGGLIEKNGKQYTLYSANDCILYDRMMTKKLTEGQKVSLCYQKKGRTLCVNNISADINLYPKTGYVIKGEKGPRKKPHAHIMVKKDNVIKNLSIAEIQTLDIVLEEYRKKKTSLYENYREAWDLFKSGSGNDMFPVRYSEAGNHIMLSPASITREVYINKLRDIIREHSSCTHPDKLCPACALFGRIGKLKKKDFQCTSRVRFSDLMMERKLREQCRNDYSMLYESITTLEPLNSPKLNNMEFYLKRPKDALFWTYDYFIDSKGKLKRYLPEINGRKFYWHNPDMKLNSVEASKLNSTVRPLKKNIKFTGCIYFNHLTSDELSKLIYTINAGEDRAVDDKNQCYKLGHGKPLGYGSIATHVDKVLLREINMDDDDQTVKYSLNECLIGSPDINTDVEKNFKIMTDFESMREKNIKYPRLSDEPDAQIFTWFAKNHATRRGGGMPRSRQDMIFKQHMYALEPELKSVETQRPEIENLK